MHDNLKIGRFFGINTYIHWSFWLLPLFVFMTSFLNAGMTSALFGTAFILALFACVALHELGHALAARHYGIRTRDIVLYPIGGVARLERMPRNAGAEIAIAIAGPAVNIAIAVALFAVMTVSGFRLGSPLRSLSLGDYFWLQIVFANFGLAAFNLIPAFPMDGGRVFRAALTWFTDRVTATSVAAKVGIGFAVLFGVTGLLNLGGLSISLPLIGQPGVMMMVLAVFLAMAAQTELLSVRREEHYRRGYVPVYDEIDWHRPHAVRHADGWEYDPQSRLWTLWHAGVAIKRVAGIR